MPSLNVTDRLGETAWMAMQSKALPLVLPNSYFLLYIQQASHNSSNMKKWVVIGIPIKD